VLAVEEGGNLVHTGLEDIAEAEEDAGAAEWRLRGPLGEGCGGGLDSGVDFGVGGERDAGLHGAGRGMEDVAEAAGGAADRSAIDPVGDLTDGGLGGGGFGGGCERGHGADSLGRKHLW
jgi:hypothetical protein